MAYKKGHDYKKFEKIKIKKKDKHNAEYMNQKKKRYKKGSRKGVNELISIVRTTALTREQREMLEFVERFAGLIRYRWVRFYEKNGRIRKKFLNNLNIYIPEKLEELNLPQFKSKVDINKLPLLKDVKNFKGPNPYRYTQNSMYQIAEDLEKYVKDTKKSKL